MRAFSSKQLVAAALEGEITPRMPTGPMAVHFCAGLAGFTLRQYTTDPRVLAESVIRYHERFQPDAVWLSADTWVSAEAMGAKVGATDDHQPFGGLGGPLRESSNKSGRPRSRCWQRSKPRGAGGSCSVPAARWRSKPRPPTSTHY